MNDAGTETAWRIAYLHINEEIENMDQYMPGLEGIKAIWDEFLPAYQGAVAAKAAIFVRHTYNYIAFRVPSGQAGLSDHLGKLVWAAAYYAKKTSEPT